MADYSGQKDSILETDSDYSSRRFNDTIVDLTENLHHIVMNGDPMDRPQLSSSMMETVVDRLHNNQVFPEKKKGMRNVSTHLSMQLPSDQTALDWTKSTITGESDRRGKQSNLSSKDTSPLQSFRQSNLNADLSHSTLKIPLKTKGKSKRK